MCYPCICSHALPKLEMGNSSHPSWHPPVLLSVRHSNIFTQSLIVRLTLNPGWHDWWPLSTHLTRGDIWVIGRSFRIIVVSHVWHDLGVVISCFRLISQNNWFFNDSKSLHYLKILHMALLWWQTFIKRELTVICWYWHRPPSFPQCTDVSTWCPDADPQCTGAHCAVSRHWLTLARRNITYNMGTHGPGERSSIYFLIYIFLNKYIL